MKRFITVWLAVFMAASLSFLIALPAGAQDQEEGEDTFELEEITVTAEKSGVQDVQKVSMSMSVISADELKLKGTTNFADALRDTAGIGFQSMFGQVYLRGVGSTTDEQGVSPGVQINTDGAPALSNVMGSQKVVGTLTNDVERIEIIRGPSGSVNGRSASAGTINIITKSPDFEKVDGNVNVTLGNYDTVLLNAALNLPMRLTGLDLPSYLEDLSFRVAMAENKHSGYIENEKGEEVSGNQNSYNFRGKMKWQPIENLDLNASFTYSRVAEDTNTSVPLLNGLQEPYASLMHREVTAGHADEPWVSEGRDEMSATSSPSRQYATNYTATYDTPWTSITGRMSYSWVPVECSADDTNCTEGDRGEKDYEFRLNNPQDSWITWNAGVAWTDTTTVLGDEKAVGVIDASDLVSFADYYSNGQYDSFGDPWKDDFQKEAIGSDYMNRQDQPWNELTGRPDLDPAENYYMTIKKEERNSQAYSFFANASIPLFEDKHRLVVGLRKSTEQKRQAWSIGAFKPAATTEELAIVEAQHDAAAAAAEASGENYTELTPYLNDGLPHWTFVEKSDSTTGEGTWYCDNCYLDASEGPMEWETDSNPISFTLGWEYDLRDDIMLYAMIRNGYKPGGISAMAFPVRFYDEETMLAYSLGTKSRWFDQRLQLNLDMYVEDYDGYQQSIASSNSFVEAEIDGKTYKMVSFTSGMVNFPRTYIYGFDFDYEWLITPNDRLSGNVAYLHADYADFQYDIGKSSDEWMPQILDFSGRMMPYSPRFTINTSYRHTFNFETFFVTPRISWQHKTKYFLHHEIYWEIVNPEVWQPASDVFDAYASIGPQDAKWNVSLYWKNITEEPVRTLAMMTDVRLNDPMTFGATFSMNF